MMNWLQLLAKALGKQYSTVQVSPAFSWLHSCHFTSLNALVPEMPFAGCLFMDGIDLKWAQPKGHKMG